MLVDEARSLRALWCSLEAALLSSVLTMGSAVCLSCYETC